MLSKFCANVGKATGHDSEEKTENNMIMGKKIIIYLINYLQKFKIRPKFFLKLLLYKYKVREINFFLLLFSIFFNDL
jgi:hypothetical protein